jgi:Fe2+ or Zn2+ uptake regulation protein
MFRQDTLHILKLHHYKITASRLWIITQIAQTDRPINPYEMLAQDTSSTIDISTIYRNLELFEWLGIVHKIHSIWWYIPCTHEHQYCHKKHDLIICSGCNTISETHVRDSIKKSLWLWSGPIELTWYCTSCETKK